jgi:AAA+ superfamily predicted ATPase
MENGNGNGGFLKPYARASFPCIWVRTVEPERFIESAVAEMKEFRTCISWDFNRGFRQEPHDGMPRVDLGQKPGQSFVSCPPEQVLMRSATGPEKAIWFLQNYHWDIENPVIIQEVINLLPLLKTNKIMFCVVSPVLKLPVELQRIFTVLDFSLPNKEDLKIILDRCSQGNNIEVKDEKAVLEASSGLTWEEAENAYTLSIVKCKDFDSRYITEQKAQMIKKSAALKLANFKETFKDIGGLDNLKNWLLNRFFNKQEDLPWRGVLLLGVPGTGKSSLAKALANEVKRACVEMSMSSMFGSLVGESEDRMRQALSVIDAMEPMILFVDEVEKGLAGVGSSHEGDSGTTKRVGGEFLKWLQDHESDVFVIATCNDLSNLPTEYTRAGRWDGIFFIDLPQPTERKQILDMYVQKFLKREIQKGEKIPNLEGYTGAEIRQLVIEAAYCGGSLEEGAKFVIPLSKSAPDRIAKLREDAKGYVPASSIVSRPLSMNELKDYCRVAQL